MLQSISPPTDSLYKFMALFGLAMLLFSFYKSGDAFRNSTETHAQLEDLRHDMQKAFWLHHHHELLGSDSLTREGATVPIRHLDSDLEEMDKALHQSSIPDTSKWPLSAQLQKLEGQTEVLKYRFIEYFCILALGLILMVGGFTLWYTRDQIHRDRLMAKGILPDQESGGGSME
ncbi:MAG TPA: hypothetical protein VFX48_08920 [Saprospiraceae bacterium]|nr:hypothetical protein [Saprospiraceae bacterium]